MSYGTFSLLKHHVKEAWLGEYAARPLSQAEGRLAAS